MYVALHELEKRQVEKILKSLECDSIAPDWRSAFFKLARHFCNVGIQARDGTTSKWTAEKENILLSEMLRLLEQKLPEGQKLSERQAIKMIGENPFFDDLLPHTEQKEVIDKRIRTSRRKHEPRKGWASMEDRRMRNSRQRRVDALRKVWESLKRRITGDPKSLERAFGLTTPPWVMHILSQLDIFPEPKLDDNK
jgi:hypothetical protein